LLPAVIYALRHCERNTWEEKLACLRKELAELRCFNGEGEIKPGIIITEEIERLRRPLREDFLQAGNKLALRARGTDAADRNGANAGFAKGERLEFALSDNKLSPERSALAWDVELSAALPRREVFCARVRVVQTKPAERAAIYHQGSGLVRLIVRDPGAAAVIPRAITQERGGFVRVDAAHVLRSKVTRRYTRAADFVINAHKKPLETRTLITGCGSDPRIWLSVRIEMHGASHHAHGSIG
jgi:hypothetical protein